MDWREHGEKHVSRFFQILLNNILIITFTGKNIEPMLKSVKTLISWQGWNTDFSKVWSRESRSSNSSLRII